MAVKNNAVRPLAHRVVLTDTVAKRAWHDHGAGAEWSVAENDRRQAATALTAAVGSTVTDGEAVLALAWDVLDRRI